MSFITLDCLLVCSCYGTHLSV